LWWRCDGIDIHGVGTVGVKNHVHRTEAQGLSALDPRFLDSGAIDEGSIGGPHVLDEGSALIDNDLAMGARDAEVLDFEVVASAAAKKIQPRLELNFPSLRRPWVNDESRHLS
jgi:hypothetical protein